MWSPTLFSRDRIVLCVINSRSGIKSENAHEHGRPKHDRQQGKCPGYIVTQAIGGQSQLIEIASVKSRKVESPHKILFDISQNCLSNNTHQRQFSQIFKLSNVSADQFHDTQSSPQHCCHFKKGPRHGQQPRTMSILASATRATKSYLRLPAIHRVHERR